MKNTFLFYDIETSGLNKAFDQVLQFAAIRTDMELQELERHEIKVRLSPDVIPAPAAVLTHKISLAEMQTGLPEVEAICQIHRLLNTPGTVSLGYNTLKFDDEFLRFSFHRNLLPPYTHQFANNCGRADLYPMIIMYYLYKRDTLSWPLINDKISLKLEHLNQFNSLTGGAAHNAMVDVLATLELAKKLKTDGKMWDYLLGYFNKESAQKRLTSLETLIIDKQSYYTGLMIDGSIGAEQHFHAPVIGLGQHRHYKNKTLWLRLDLPDLVEVTDETIADKTWCFGKKINETGLLMPFSTRHSQHLSPERNKIYQHNLACLQNNPQLLSKIADYHLDYTYPVIPNLDVDAGLYANGFLSDAENLLCQQFHRTPIENKPAVLERINNPILWEQVIRILGRHYPQCLPGSLKEEFQLYLNAVHAKDDSAVMLDYRGQKRLTPQTALSQIAELRLNTSLGAHELTLLNELESHINRTPTQ